MFSIVSASGLLFGALFVAGAVFLMGGELLLLVELAGVELN